jgi:iron complex outermembrane receptor protein
MPFLKAAVVGAAASLSLTLLLISAAYARAADAAPQPFDIRPQSLAAALSEFARQSHEELLFAPEVVARKGTHGVRGTMEPLAALKILLKDSGLSYSTTPAGAILVGSAGSTNVAGIASATTSAAGQSDDSSARSGLQLAQVDQGQTSSPSTVDKQEEQTSKKKPDQLEEVVVTGSRIPTTSKQGAQDVKIYTKEQIDRSGQTTVADFLNTLPDVSVAIRENGAQTPLGATTVQLHGLPIGTTLVLLNGRRLETSGTQGNSNFFDLNNIPLSAVERIEMVADGSSAVYGSDAIAGVVNIILKKNFDGFEASARYGAAAGNNEWDTSLAWGKGWERGSVTVVGSYQTRGQLAVSERELTKSSDYRAYGGVDNNINACNPGNVFSADGVTPLPGLGGATFAAVPAGFTGRPSIQEFSATAGILNECPPGQGNDIIPETHRAGVFAQGRFALTPAVELFTEVLYSRVRQDQSGGLNNLYGIPGFQVFTVSAANPYNPFGTTVGIAGLFTSIPVRQINDTDFFRPLVGAKGHLPNGWEWEVSAWSSHDYTNNHEPSNIENNSAIQNALNSSNPTTALNPFIAGPYGSAQLLQSFFSNAQTTYAGRGDAVNGYMRGPVIQLPAGAIDLLAGAEYDRDMISFDEINDGFDPPNTRSDEQRHSYAVFGEARIPIVGNGGDSNRGDVLVLRLAERHDHYETFGTKNTPQVGLEWRPFPTLLVRGTYAEAFKAPSMENLYSPDFFVPNTFGIDPRTGKVVTFTDFFGGNQGLKPETGQSHTFGLVWTSRAVPDLTVSITNWDVRENDAIQSLPTAVILANENLFPGRVIRDPNGNVTEVNASYINVGGIDTAGIDYALMWKHATGLGDWTPSVSASQTYRYGAALTPNVPAINSDSVAQDSGNWAPRWKGSVAIGWKLGPYAASFTGHYVSRYQDYDSTREIGNFWLYDANFYYSAGRAFAADNPWLKDAYLEVGGVNIFNKQPQFSNFNNDTVGYDPTQADIRGRFLYAQVGTKW